MKTTKQREAARRNIKKASEVWRQMSHRQHALAQLSGQGRAKPGSKGTGNYYRIIVRPKVQFITFRHQDVGERGHLLRLAGKRTSGSWDTHAWLISKKDAELKNDKLVPKSQDAKELLENLGSTPVHENGDIFKAKDRPNIPEIDKPTKVQTKARNQNIRKAQAAHRSM